MNVKLIQTMVATFVLFTSNQVLANERNRHIGQCVAGAQFQFSMAKRNPSIISKEQINRETLSVAQRYIDRVEPIETKTYEKCKEITPECLRATFKNNDDYEIADSYFQLLGIYVQNKSSKNADIIITAGNLACWKLNQKK